MTDRKRFQNQKLNSDDYKKTEEGASLVRNGVAAIAAVASLVGGKLIMKHGPGIVKRIGSLIKS